MSRVAMSYEVITRSLAPRDVARARFRSAARRRGGRGPAARVRNVRPRGPTGGSRSSGRRRASGRRRSSRTAPLRGEHRDRLHRLPEAHVVGQDRADAEVAQQAQPAVPALLEREERLGHRRRRAERLEAPVASPPASSSPERVVQRDLAELEPGVLQLDARDGADEVDDRSPRGAGRGSGARARPRTGAARASARAPGSAAPSQRRAPRAPASVSVVSPIASCQSKRASASVVSRPLERRRRSWR